MPKIVEHWVSQTPLRKGLGIEPSQLEGRYVRSKEGTPRLWCLEDAIKKCPDIISWHFSKRAKKISLGRVRLERDAQQARWLAAQNQKNEQGLCCVMDVEECYGYDKRELGRLLQEMRKAIQDNCRAVDGYNLRNIYKPLEELDGFVGDMALPGTVQRFKLGKNEVYE